MQSSQSTIGSLVEWGEQPCPFCREEWGASPGKFKTRVPSFSVAEMSMAFKIILKTSTTPFVSDLKTKE